MSALTITDLSIDFPTTKGVVHAVSDLSLSVGRGRRVGFIGESGSGKTTTALAVMQMLAEPGRVAKGSIVLGDTDMLALNEEEMRKARLRRVSYIPQGAMNSLNPIMRIEDQLWDGITAHEGTTDRAELKRRSDEALESVGLPARVGRLYPHELSGGMKQRVCIALGVILTPDLIIADEPTSALDVVTQRHVMQTLKDVQAKIGAGLILIGHDMALGDDVERARGFVRDDKIRRQDHAKRNADALLHAAGQLVRIKAPDTRWKTNTFERLIRTALEFGLVGCTFMRGDAVPQLIFDAHDRVKRVHRPLRNVADAA